jgi:BirA family biotin operon repressor/biotin-[acetyl-CoA-carboxylase] ligase
VVKPLTFPVLRLLADGQFRSGEEIARELGVCRASVSNALKDLEQFGISLYKVRGRGYRMPEAPRWLEMAGISSALGERAHLFDLEVLDSVDSTNTLLLRKAALGAPAGSCVVAELQTAGRGRRGRQWQGSLGGSLTFSLLWRFGQGAAQLSGLSLAVGVALMRALRDAGVSGVGLKWPNDVVHGYRKLAGILIELQGDMLGPSAAVIGVGLNVRLAGQTIESIDQAAVDLHTLTGTSPDRNRLLAMLLGRLADVLQQFEGGGFAALREEWTGYHAYHGKPVRLIMPTGYHLEGTVLDVADDGALVVRSGEGIQRFTSGELSLRAVGTPAVHRGAV